MHSLNYGVYLFYKVQRESYLTSSLSQKESNGLSILHFDLRRMPIRCVVVGHEFNGWSVHAHQQTFYRRNTLNHFKIPKNSKNFLKICVGDSKPTVVEFDPKKEYGFEDFNMLIGADRGEIVSLDAVRGMLPDAFIKDNGISSIDMWCDEEGTFKEDASMNMIASLLCGREIVGDVLLMTSDKHGCSHPLNEVLARLLVVLTTSEQFRFLMMSAHRQGIKVALDMKDEELIGFIFSSTNPKRCCH